MLRSRLWKITMRKLMRTLLVFGCAVALRSQITALPPGRKSSEEPGRQKDAASSSLVKGCLRIRFLDSRGATSRESRNQRDLVPFNSRKG